MRLDEKKLQDYIRDLRSAYNKALVEAGTFGCYTRRNTLLQRAVNTPASSWYVSREEASKVIHFLEKRGMTGRKNKLLAEKYNALYRAYLKKQQEYPELPFMIIVDMVIDSPAPKFYIKAQTAGLLLNKYINL
jgi:hypothetical protein